MVLMEIPQEWLEAHLSMREAVILLESTGSAPKIHTPLPPPTRPDPMGRLCYRICEMLGL